MKTYLHIIIFLIIIGMDCRANERNDLLKELDLTVSERQFYMDKKENRIDSLRSLLTSDLTLESRYILNSQIYKEYNTYRCDSAMKYVFLNQEIARQLNIRKYKDEATINLSMLLSTTGMYRESIENLTNIDRAVLDSSLLYLYYEISEWTYYAAGEYSNDNLYTPVYKKIMQAYTDSVFSVLTEHTPLHNYYKGKKLQYDGKFEDALNIFLGIYPAIPVDTRLYAITTYDIANIYYRFGNLDLYEKFLILAAISDQICPLKENLAMQELALYLFRHKPDEINRAHRYIECSMEDARFYNNRLRMVQISEKMPVIIKAYQEKSEKEKQRFKIGLIAITFLSLVIIALLLYVYKQMNLVRKSQGELQVLNNELNLLNVKLHESNNTKEEYVGVFVDLCSSYIDKLDKYREMVKRKLMAKQVDDLYKMVNSTRAIETEVDDFLHSFDNAFLKLYPTFIEDLNALLLPEEKILPRKEEILNRELRIFALIRLGINDSSKIASFLRYSPQTIYNNRTKVKNKAIRRNDFEKDILNIGNHNIRKTTD